MTTGEAFDNLPRITEEGAQEMGHTILLKGFSKAGKSSAAVGFPEPILYINSDPNKGVARAARAAGRNIDLIPLRSFQDYENVILPSLKNREPDVRTVVVDDASSLGKMLVDEAKGTKARPSRDDYASILNRHWSGMQILTDTATPKGDHPGYIVVVTARLKEDTSEDGALERYQCCMWGQFKDHIESFFNYVLLCEGGTASEVVGNVSKLVRQFKIYTVPPNRYHTCAGGELPPVITVGDGESAFSILNQYWKIKE
jgi:hypothetical protein